jgi:3-oxoacyl-[acyl-carrier protein] reductase
VNLSVRNALITGVSRRVGIGYAIASHLLDAGAAVFIQGWTPHDADQPWGAEPGGTEVVARGLGVPFLEADFADAEAPNVWSSPPRRSLGRSTSSLSIMLVADTAASLN